MTTIAYNHKDKELAVDSQATSGDLATSITTKKIHRIDGAWVAFCGSLVVVEEFIWALDKDVANLGSLTDEISGIVMYDTGSVYNVFINPLGRVVKLKINENFAAGSGRSIALGALYVGATATQAVKAAIRYDIYSSGRIITKKMGDLK